MSRLIKIGEFSKIAGVSSSTLRRMHESGELVPSYVSPKGSRYYTKEQATAFTHNTKPVRHVIGYCRVPSETQKEILDQQIEHIRMFMLNKGYSFEIISDIGLGIDCNRDGLKHLITDICLKKVSRVVVPCKDSLVRFGFDLFRNFCCNFDCAIEIMNRPQYATNEQKKELCVDVVQIVTEAAQQLYGTKSEKTKDIVDRIVQDFTCTC